LADWHTHNLKETTVKFNFFIALMASLCVSTLVSAQPATASEALNIKALAATCANCHGTQGKAVEGSAVVTLAGLPKDYIVTQMKAFKSGERSATIMHQLSKGYTDAQIEQIATYFAAQKK
jgi:cytochrome subunit of sulfide dehydrogenase